MIATRAMRFGRIAACLTIAALLLPMRPVAAEIVNKIVATVDGDPITAHEVRRYGEERRAHGVTWETLLEAVITDKILEKEIAARKIAARREDIDRYIAEVRAKNNNMTEEQFAAALKEQGITVDAYRARVKSEMEKTQLLGQELRGGPPTISDEEVKDYYEAHKDEWAVKSAVVVRDIFLPFHEGMTQQDAVQLMEQAKSIKQMADSGQSFEALARRYSQGPGADRGGLLGTFKRGEMAPALEHVVFALHVGEVSQPIPGPNGIHILKLDGMQATDHVELDVVKDEIRQILANQSLDDRFRDWISKNLRERHHVEVLN